MHIKTEKKRIVERILDYWQKHRGKCIEALDLYYELRKDVEGEDGFASCRDDVLKLIEGSDFIHFGNINEYRAYLMRINTIHKLEMHLEEMEEIIDGATLYYLQKTTAHLRLEIQMSKRSNKFINV